jgi:pyruvate formate lyase activating enzyme
MPSAPPPSPSTAYVSNVQRFCVHDGPGIRTVVFFQGCPLRCAWCQNPETLDGTPSLMVNSQKCAGCAACVEACEQKAVYQSADGSIRFDRARCTACGACVTSCYYRARELSGRPWAVDGLMKVIGRDRVVYRNSGGGVTLSGGEPLLHPGFARELLRRCKAEGIHTAVETCGAVPWTNIESILEYTDLFLYDIKLVDPVAHQRWMGTSNTAVLENARSLAARGARLIPRVPLIPQVNDGEEEFRAIARFCASLQSGGELHILPFHQVGSSKYELVGKGYRMGEVPEENTERAAACGKIAEECGLRVSIGGSGLKNEVDEERARTAAKTRKRSFLYGFDGENLDY